MCTIFGTCSVDERLKVASISIIFGWLGYLDGYWSFGKKNLEICAPKTE